LLLVGVLLVMVELWLLARLNNRGPVTLEFVGCVHRGTNLVDGTIVAFRLSNRSGTAITYSGTAKTSPSCEVIPMVADEFRVLGGTLPGDRRVSLILGFITYHYMPTDYYVIESGEERIIYALVGQAEQSWRLKMDYQEGKVAGDWVNRLPVSAQSLFVRDYVYLPANTVLSEPVNRVIASRYWRDAKSQYFMTGFKTNRNGRVTAKMKSSD